MRVFFNIYRMGVSSDTPFFGNFLKKSSFKELHLLKESTGTEVLSCLLRFKFPSFPI